MDWGRHQRPGLDERLDTVTTVGGRPLYYDRQGQPMTLRQWCEAFEARTLDEWNEKRRIGEDEIGDTRVSTVWLGLDHSFNIGEDRPPLIFETMVFDKGDNDQWMDRYSTEEEARAGHARVVACLRNGLPLPSGT